MTQVQVARELGIDWAMIRRRTLVGLRVIRSDTRGPHGSGPEAGRGNLGIFSLSRPTKTLNAHLEWERGWGKTSSPVFLRTLSAILSAPFLKILSPGHLRSG